MKPGQGQSAAAGPTRVGRIVLGVVFAGVFLIGASALQSGLSLLFDPAYSNRIGAFFAVLLGAALVAASVWYLYRAHLAGPRRLARLQRIEKQYPGQPWMARDDWAARRVTHTSSGLAIFLWIWTIGWWGFLSFIGWVNHDKIMRALSQSWWNGALMAVFVGAGLLGLSFAIRATAHWLRYGTSVLRIDTLPAYTGERFRGVVEARLRVKPRFPLSVELVCEELEWVTSGHGKDRQTRVNVTRLGASRATVAPSEIVGAREGVHVKIDIAVPPDLPGYSIDERGDGVRWILNVTTTGEDAGFSCAFETPVYARG